MSEIFHEIIAAIFISVGVIYYNNKVANILDEKQFMVKALFMILFLLILLFISDKLFFPDRELMSKEGRLALFGLIEKLLLIMFGFYFGQNQR
jgi:magnesium-transporting ATPase (P-type)